MADNITLPGTSSVVATDAISSVEFQRIKLIHGKEGINDGDVSTNNGFPVRAEEACSDAFGRFRSSSPRVLFSSDLKYDKAPLDWESSTGGSSTDTHAPASSGTTIAVTTNAETVRRQTRLYFRAPEGRGMLLRIGGVFGAAVAGVDRRMGLFDTDNGIFLEQNSTTALNVVSRSKQTGSIVNTVVARASWNIDVMDGTGESGVTLDITDAQIFVVDMAGPLVGSVRVGFVVNGRTVYVHRFANENVRAVPYQTTGVLPIRFEVINTTGASAAGLLCLGVSLHSEGDSEEPLGHAYSANNGKTVVSSIGATELAVISIRPRALFNSIANRAAIIPQSFSIYSTSQAGIVRVVQGAALGGSPSYSNADSNSVVEFDVAGTTVTGGTTVFSAYTDKKENLALPLDLKIPLALNIAAGHPTSQSDVLTVTFQTLAGTTNCLASLNWKEIR
jgi:hypothetical protein